MPSIQPPNIRFSGYRRTNAGTADLYLPGHSRASNVEAEVLKPCCNKPQTIAMQRQDDYWVSEKPVPVGSAYRFKINDQDDIEATYTELDADNPEETTFTKQGAYWEPTEAPDPHTPTIYRIPITDNPRFRVEKHAPGKPPELIPIARDGKFWTFTTRPQDDDPSDTTYRLAPALDQSEVTQHPQYGPFNLIAKSKSPTPQKGSVIADIYLDSLVTQRQLAELDAQNRDAQGLPEPKPGQVPVLPMRDHFQQMAVGQPDSNEAGLMELVPRLQNAGFSALLFKPFIGGDNVSSHRYWTIDPYVLNNSFQNKNSFRQALNTMLASGMKIYADGAFVNQGLNGVHVMSNLAHGYNSPYWRWLKSGDENNPGGPQLYPSLAYRNYVFGILPTHQAKETGLRTINYSRFAFRILNDPKAPNGQYNPKQPTLLQLYDPQLEDAAGNPRTDKNPRMRDSQDSVQKLSFPISVDELAQKRKQLDKQFPPSRTNPNSATKVKRAQAQKKLFCDWKNFRLEKAASDDSAVKWDGQTDVAMMNTKNQDVVDYLDGAVAYWSRMVMNTQTTSVAQVLGAAKRLTGSDDPLALLDAVTQKPRGHDDEEARDPYSLELLPPLTNPEVEAISAEDAKKIVADTKPNCDLKGTGAEFSKRLLTEIPLSVLPLPTLFKANLCYPPFQAALRNDRQGTFSDFIDHKILKPLSFLPAVGGFFKRLRTLFFPPSFEKQLARKMGKVFSQLENPDTQDKLRYANMQSLLADKIGERIYLSLFTGLDLAEVRKLEDTPEALEKAFYKGMPAHILKADPVTASKLLPELLTQRLKKLKPVQLANQVEQELQHLDPQLVALAEETVKRREFGLNWRIDAAKDVADMDRVRNAEPTARPRLFQEEVQSIKKFWDQLTKSMRAPFPKAAVIAELTDFEMLTNYDQQAARNARGKLLQENTFTSLPNLSYVYSPILQLIGYAQRPDEYGDTQLSPGDFMRKIQAMGEDVPVPALHQYQNLTASHDYPTTSHALLINPQLFNMDLLKWWGLKDDFGVAADELASKACFEETRRELHIDDLQPVLQALRDVANDPDRFSSQVRQFFDEHSKLANEATLRPTPPELKGRFVDELFSKLEPDEIELETQEQMDALKLALKARMQEPSEAKAMRGAIVNAARDLPVERAFNSIDEKQEAESALWQALDRATQKWGRHFGYQPLDMALNHVFEKLDTEQLPQPMQNPARLESWKSAIYQQATQPVMENLLKVFAVQNALPGNPSVYLPDLFAQGGSEWTKNIFSQNRNLIRVDKFHDEQFKRFFDEVGQIFKTRSNPELQVLNDGIVLPVTPDDENGVLPIVRDNGRQQAIVLVNTGVPRPLDWNHKAGTEAQYETAHRLVNDTDVRNYKTDLSELDLPEGTRYRDVNTGEEFVINAQQQLVRADDADAGIDIRTWRTLIRVPAHR